MNGFWMDGSWWEYVVVAITFSFFFLYFWCMGSWFEASGKYKKDAPAFVHGVFFADKKAAEEKYDTPENVALAIWIARGVASTLGIIFFLGVQLHLWINYSGGHVTLERALIAQLTMFFPFLLFNYLGAHFFQRYLNKLPEREDAPIA